MDATMKWSAIAGLILGGLLILFLTGCSGGDTSSNSCQTFTDANGNPVTQCGQEN